MELVCHENIILIKQCRSMPDPVFTDDERVLKNLLSTQQRYTIKSSYFKCVQTEIDETMRQEVSNWMLEVTEEERCEEDVFPLAINILDRFLSLVRIKRTQLQLLGSVCLFLASKLRQSKQLKADRLILLSDGAFTRDQLEGWELLVLSQLNWDLAAVTPNDFLNLILKRLPSRGKGKNRLMKIKRHAQAFINICATDFRFSSLPPSSIAASCIATAIMGLHSNKNTVDFLAQLCKLVSIELIDLLDIRETLEDILKCEQTVCEV